MCVYVFWDVNSFVDINGDFIFYFFILKCQFGHPNLFRPPDSATKEEQCDNSFKTVHNAKVKL